MIVNASSVLNDNKIVIIPSYSSLREKITNQRLRLLNYDHKKYSDMPE
jgi:hypothetical protein